MPFIKLTKEESPLYININNVAGLKLTVESETNTTVRIFASRSELDTNVIFDTEAEAKAFMDEIELFSLKASQPFLEATVTTTTTVPKRAVARQWKNSPAKSSIM
jgi:hypothetical protein